MHYTLFPKFFQQLSDEKLMEVCNLCRIDSPMVLCREGFPLSPENLSVRLPQFCRAAEKAGLSVQTACVDWVGEDLVRHADRLKQMADCGISMVRAGLCFRDIPIPQLAERAERQARFTVQAAEMSGLRILIQLHHFAYPHNATAASMMLKGLDPARIGVWLDSGNNTFEGDEHPDYQAGLLGSYIGAFGAKDAAYFRDGDGSAGDKGWRCRFVPVFAGRTDWQAFFKAVMPHDPYAVLMPFYEMPYDLFVRTLTDEVEYLRNTEKMIG